MRMRSAKVRHHVMPHMSRRLLFFNDTATTEIYTLSLHDALPISDPGDQLERLAPGPLTGRYAARRSAGSAGPHRWPLPDTSDRKSTRLNSRHANITYAVFRLNRILSVIFARAVQMKCAPERVDGD